MKQSQSNGSCYPETWTGKIGPRNRVRLWNCIAVSSDVVNRTSSCFREVRRGLHEQTAARELSFPAIDESSLQAC